MARDEAGALLDVKTPALTLRAGTQFVIAVRLPVPLLLLAPVVVSLRLIHVPSPDPDPDPDPLPTATTLGAPSVHLPRPVASVHLPQYLLTVQGNALSHPLRSATAVGVGDQCRGRGRRNGPSRLGCR
jgi:hypothetical protein